MQPTSQRIRFNSVQDWHNFVGANPTTTLLDILNFRLNCYRDIEALRGRPLLVYATKFLDVPAVPIPNSIVLEDVDGFTDLVNSLDGEKSVDVLIHSPGGRPDATERIVSILRNKFEEVHFLVPHSAYSAATMLALSGDSITIHPSGTLGPIDPQFNNIPARSIKRGFDKVKDSIKSEGPEALPAYIPLIEKYSLDLLEQCSDAEELSQELVGQWLSEHMFKSDGDEQNIKEAVVYFSNYDEHKLHSRPLLFEKVKGFGLNIEQSSGELSKLLWESYVLINGFFSTTAFCKLFENTRGISWGKQFSMTPIQTTPPPTAQQQ